MRKLYYILLVLLVSFVGMFEIKADAATDPHHIYHVKQLNINTGSNTIDVYGFAFVDHRDNIGGTNLATQIIASNGSKSYSVEVEYYTEKEYDYYFARCMDSTNGAGDKCSKARADAVRNGGRGANCNLAPGSDCAYFNVDFKATINLQAMYNELGGDSEISFTIASTVAGAPTQTSDFGVSMQNCRVNGNPGCENGVPIHLGNGEIKLFGLSNTVKATITNGLARYSNFNPLGSGIYYSNHSFSVKRYYEGGVFQKVNSNVSFVSDYYEIYGSLSGNRVNSGGSSVFIISDTWVQVDGKLKITFGDIIEEVPDSFECLRDYTKNKHSTLNATCGKDNDPLRTCKEVKLGNISAVYDLTPEEEAEANQGDQTCAGDKASVTINSQGLSVLIHQNGLFNFGGASGSVDAGRGFLFPTLTYKNYFFGIYNYDVVNLLYAGKTYTIEWNIAEHHSAVYDTYTDPITGVTTSTLVQPEYWDCGKTKSYTFTAYTVSDRLSFNGEKSINLKDYVEKKLAPGKMQENVDTNNISNYQTMSPRSYESNGEYNTSLKVVEGNYIPDKPKVSNYTKNSDLFYVYNFNGISPDTVAGYNEGSVPPEYKYSVNLVYDIDDPYIKVVEEGAGKMSDVYYGDKPNSTQYIDLTPNHYFVSVLFPDGGKFPIVYNNQYLSFIKDINWYLNGNCSITVKNYVYDCKGSSCDPKFRYRPIDLQEPFPKNSAGNRNIPKNWSSWWNNSAGDYRNQKRVRNTYNNGVFYSIDLIHGSNTNGKKIAIGDTSIFNDMYYNSWINITNTGKSTFITEGIYNKIASENSYCPNGYASSSGTGCDQY